MSKFDFYGFYEEIGNINTDLMKTKINDDGDYIYFDENDKRSFINEFSDKIKEIIKRYISK